MTKEEATPASLPGRGSRDRWEEVGLRLLLGGLRILPEGISVRTAATVTSGFGRIAGNLRQIGLANLAIAFPEKSEAWREATLQDTFANLGRLAAEFAHFPQLNETNIGSRVRFASAADEQRWGQTIARGSSIMATGHFGNWEMLLQAHGLWGKPVTVVYRNAKNPLVDKIITDIRQRHGNQMFPKRSAARVLLRGLRAGKLIALPIDQREAGGKGVPVPFFGRLAATTLGPARLSQLAQIPLQVMVIARRGKSLQHEIVVQEPIAPPPKRDKDPELLIATMEKVHASYEDCIRRYPSQWLWVHQRWRP